MRNTGPSGGTTESGDLSELIPLPAYARYEPCRWSGERLQISGQVAVRDGDLLHRGSIGEELTIEQGQACARQCALNVLARLYHEVGDLSRVEVIEKITVFVASAPAFWEQHLVADGASDAFVEYLGERGRHARSALGVVRLPMNSPVEVEAIVRARR